MRATKGACREGKGTMRTALVWTVTAALLLSLGPGAAAQSSGLPDRVAVVEEIIFGRDQAGVLSLVERVVQLEKELYGVEGSGPLLARVQKMHEELVAGGGGTSLLMRLNAIEWMLYQEVSPAQALGRRIDQLEAQVIGERQTGPLRQRIDRLMDLVWPGGQLNTELVEIPKETLVLIRLEANVDSGQNRVGELIPFRVAEDVMVDDRLVIPAGTEGAARVTKVTSAGMMGRSGKVELDFGTLKTMDGTSVRLAVAERAAKENTELAAAASVGGLVLLGPIGLVGGVFVQGREHVIPAGTELYVEVERPVKAAGLSLTPVGV